MTIQEVVEGFVDSLIGKRIKVNDDDADYEGQVGTIVARSPNNWQFNVQLDHDPHPRKFWDTALELIDDTAG